VAQQNTSHTVKLLMLAANVTEQRENGFKPTLQFTNEIDIA
jgi:hypothetical protein